jgi:hypothetical protein
MGRAFAGEEKARYCSFLLAVLLVFTLLIPYQVVSRTQAAVAGGTPEIIEDPLGRLPSTPGEAHERLEENKVDWPSGEEAEATGYEAAGVQHGLRVAIPYDTVEGFTTHANTNVQVELYNGAVLVHTIIARTNNSKWFYAYFGVEGYDIQSGDSVKVTDLAGGDTVTVNCTLTGSVNVSSNSISGNAPSGNQIDAYVKIPNTYYGVIPPGVEHLEVTASGGTYTAGLTGTNIRNGDAAYIFSTDKAGHVVMNIARTGPILVVYPQYDEVMGFYNPSASVSVKAGSATQTVGSAGDGFFDAWFMDHDIVPGESVSSGSLGTPRSITVGDISATADPFTDVVKGTAPPGRPMRITMNTYYRPVMVELASAADGTYSYDFTGICDISGIEVYNVAWYNDAGDCVAYEFFTYSWYMPEGYTGQGFDTWALAMNPGDKVAKIRMVFQTLTGQVEGPLISAVPHSRVTVRVNDWVPYESHVSTMVTAIDGASIMSERAMYMYGTVDGKWGSHDSIGILTPSAEWCLPEGATYPGFDEWVLIQNPNNVPVQARVQFLGMGGVVDKLTVYIGATSRFTVHVNEFVPGSEISTRVESLTESGGEVLPVFAERAMYMATADGKRGAHDSIGLSASASEWYLPEGTTRPGFDEWVLVMNPGELATTVRATFLTPDGIGGTYEMVMPGNSRGTIHVNDYLPGEDISTVVTSLDGAGILAERAMYINTADGKRGAHDSIGSYQTSTYWYLPEGTTRPGFDVWVLVQNPNDVAAEVRVSLLGPDGTAAQTAFLMPAESRQTVHVNDLVDNLDVSAVVECVGASPVGILAERAMYMWTPDFKQGSHCSIGVPAF